MKDLLFILVLLTSSVLFACGDGEYYEIVYADESSEVVMICSQDPKGESISIKDVEDEAQERVTRCENINEIYIENDWKNKVMYLGAAGASVGALGVVTIPAGALVGGVIGWGVWIVNEINNEPMKANFCKKQI